MTKKDLIIHLQDEFKHTKVQKKEMDEIVNHAFGTIHHALVQGEEVAIAGFGKFMVVDRQARKGRNPSTGQEIDIPASKAVRFKVSKTLKDAVNNK